MNYSRRRALRLSALSLTGTGILASTGSRTALAANIDSPETVDIETDGDALSTLQIAESDLDFSLEWKGIKDTSKPVEFDIGVQHDDGDVHWLADDTPWEIALSSEAGNETINANDDARWSPKPSFPLALIGTDAPFGTDTFTADGSPHDLTFTLEFYHPDAGTDTASTSLTLNVSTAFPDGLLVDDWDDGEFSATRNGFGDRPSAVQATETGLYEVEARPQWNVVSGSPSNDGGRLFLSNANSNGLQHVEHMFERTDIDITNIEWEFEVERTSGNNNSAQFGLILDSYSNGGVWLNYQMNNDDTAGLDYYDGSSHETIAYTTIASGSSSGTNHWRIVKEGDDWTVELDGVEVVSATHAIDLDMNGVWLSNGEVMGKGGSPTNFNSDIWVNNYYANPY